MFIRAIALLGGLLMILIALAGFTLWVQGFDFLREMTFKGARLILKDGDNQVQIPGRLAAAIIVAVPFLGSFGGYLLLRSAFAIKEERDT